MHTNFFLGTTVCLVITSKNDVLFHSEHHQSFHFNIIPSFITVSSLIFSLLVNTNPNSRSSVATHPVAPFLPPFPVLSITAQGTFAAHSLPFSRSAEKREGRTRVMVLTKKKDESHFCQKK